MTEMCRSTCGFGPDIVPVSLTEALEINTAVTCAGVSCCSKYFHLVYKIRTGHEQSQDQQNSQGTTGDQESPSPASSSCSCICSSSDSCLCTETTEKTKSSSTLRQECLPSVAEGVLNHVADSSALIWEQTVSSLADMTLEEDEKDKEDTCTDTDDVTEEVSLLLVFCGYLMSY